MNHIIKNGTQNMKEVFLKTLSQINPIRKVCVFLDNDNFLMTDFQPKTPNTNLILQDDVGNEIHIEFGNCGYQGEGPDNTVWVLQTIGVDLETARKLVYNNDGLQFTLSDNRQIQTRSINTRVLFCPSQRLSDTFGIIEKTMAAEVNLDQKKVMLLNPQYNCFSGLLRAISDMKIKEMEYYIGENSPLENFFRFNIDYNLRSLSLPKSSKNFNMSGLSHVNLSLRGQRFDISCLVAREVELPFINTIYTYLTGDTLFNDNIMTQYYKYKTSWLMRKKNFVFHKTIKIMDKEDRKYNEHV